MTARLGDTATLELVRVHDAWSGAGWLCTPVVK
jgi:hypothetical protein